MAEKLLNLAARNKEGIKQVEKVSTHNLFRMPWSMSDNAFTWLEITRRCDLNCSYCYQKSDPESNKTLFQIEQELIATLGLRKTDTVFITGGEPLLHPDLEAIVKTVKAYRVKPVLMTNGNRLNEDKVKALKEAGLFGFIIHVDRGQDRPAWKDKTEKLLNNLRQEYADMIHKAGGMICGFNTTILPETINELPDIVEWTVKNIDKVCTNTIIPVRVLGKETDWDLYVNNKRIKYEETAFSTREYATKTHKELTSPDLIRQVKRVIPNFKANSFLGGTEVPDAPKWLFSNVIGTKEKIYGFMGSGAMELMQNGYHFFKGRYLSFLKTFMYGMGKMMFPLGIMDRDIRKSLFSYLVGCLKNPLNLFEKVYIQSLLILQPQDILEDGRQDLCDGCPNKTYHNGGLVSACRKEEYVRFGGMVTLKKRVNVKNLLTRSHQFK
ncbi:MAG: radical SAM protein [Deltaproteobacteria bacterium]|nr:radical SAM protein [Deltaproteobacteria bacterium]